VSQPNERLGVSHIVRAKAEATMGLRRYTAPVALVAAALVLRSVLDPWLQNVAYLQFFSAILIAAWYGGLGPGVVATTASVLAAMYFLLPPEGIAIVASDIVSLALFVATGRARRDDEGPVAVRAPA
jgi:K+-sensing histidine kinase KdpD